jgi:hypothetical protein
MEVLEILLGLSGLLAADCIAFASRKSINAILPGTSRVDVGQVALILVVHLGALIAGQAAQWILARITGSWIAVFLGLMQVRSTKSSFSEKIKRLTCYSSRGSSSWSFPWLRILMLSSSIAILAKLAVEFDRFMISTE